MNGQMNKVSPTSSVSLKNPNINRKKKKKKITSEEKSGFQQDSTLLSVGERKPGSEEAGA